MFWFLSEDLAKYLFPKTEQDEKEDFNIDKIQSAVVAIIGVFVLVHALPELGVSIFTYISAQEGMHDRSIFYSGIIYTSVKSVLGLGLIFGANGLSNFLSMIRRL